MSTVAITELVVQTHVNTDVRTAEGIIHSADSICQMINNIRLNIELPLLIIAEVEGQVNTQFAGHSSLHTLRTTIVVQPAKTANTNQLKATGSAWIATEPVADVQSKEEADVGHLNKSLQIVKLETICVSIGIILPEISLSINSHTYNRSEPTAKTDTTVIIDILEYCVVLRRSSNTTVDTNVPVISVFALQNGLSINGLCKSCNSQH